ncbi:MAG: MoxR family ATPase, partial [Bacteroidota bacterium]
KELGGLRLSASQDLRPIVIMTSNSEKNLPEAFLRRCVFLHIPFPIDKLKDIVGKHLEENSPYVNQSLIDHFIEIRSQVKKKKPSTAELIGWLRMLEIENFLDDDVDLKNLTDKQKKLLRYSYSVLAKDKEDLKILVDRYKLGS